MAAHAGTEHDEINTGGQTKWESEIWLLGGPFSSFLKKKKNRFADWLIKLVFYREKNRILSFLLLSFFIFCFPHLQPWSAARVVFSTIPSHLVMFCFTMLGSQVNLYFWNRMPHYFVSARGAYKFLAYILKYVAGYWASWPDTEQHRSSAKILISRWKQRQKGNKGKKIKLSFIKLRTK